MAFSKFHYTAIRGGAQEKSDKKDSTELKRNHAAFCLEKTVKNTQNTKRMQQKQRVITCINGVFVI